MSARYVQGNADMEQFLAVATAQYVEKWDAVALQSSTIVRASDITWGTAVAAPTAPTLADSAVSVGGPLTNALTGVKISYQFPWGEGALSTAATVTPTTAASILVSGAPLVPGTNAIFTNIYVETAAGSGIYKWWGSTLGATALVSTYGTGRLPPTAAASGAKEATQFAFAMLFAGMSTQRKCSASGANQALFGNNARIYGNSADNQIMVARAGIFEFDCVSATFTPGQYVGMAKDTGNTLLNQTVVLVAGPGLAIGRVVADSNYGGVLQASTRVMVNLRSTLLPVPANIYQASSTTGGVLSY